MKDKQIVVVKGAVCHCLASSMDGSISHCTRHGVSKMRTTTFDKLLVKETKLRIALEDEQAKHTIPWKWIAVAAMWIGVGLSAFGAGIGAIFIAFCAMVATTEISNKDDV